MEITVVRAVRAAESAPSEPLERLSRLTHSGVPSRTTAMDVPFADTVIRLDFASADFSDTVSSTL
jgi:hypothetical protein